VIGFGLGLSIPSTNVLVARLNPDRPGAALSYLNLLWALGAIGCPLLFAAAAKQAPAAGAAPWVLALCAAAAWIAVARTTQPEPGGAPVADVATAHGVPIEALVLLTAQLFAYSGTECSIGGWIAKYYTEVDPTDAARGFIVNAFFWAGLLGGRLLTPTILERWAEARLHVAALGVTAAGVLELLMARSFAGFTAGALVVGLGLAPLFPLLAAAVVRRTEGARRRVSGRMFSIGGLGSGIVPWMAGLIADRSGSVRESFLVPAVGVAAMSFMLWRYRSLRSAPDAIPDGILKNS
jgi:fucose permease